MFFEDIITLDIPHTKSMLKALLEERGVRVKKQWGQNFLIDQNLLQFIVKAAELGSNDVVLEIGTGTGSLTRLLTQNARHVFAVELDRRLFEIMKETLKDYNNVTTFNKDILKSKHHIHPLIVESITDYIQSAPSPENLSVKVVSNLPYYISTPVIIDLLQEVLPIKTMIVMLQKDTTDRMKAIPGTRNYGVLSIMAKLFADVKVLKKLPPDVFWPVPLVDSAIVKMTINRHRYADRVRDYQDFQNVIHAIYVSRRKTLLNSLLSFCSGLGINNKSRNIRNDLITIVERTDIRPESRGEELDLEKLIDLSNGITEYLNTWRQSVQR
ncbi:dimethyladenosine transferase [Candidatus Scalindua japonica]|uniref:Ribosomal RNA small subunit methyltransferase A n=2 Tax=Candidatus Scalindua japonica TaxID=1284222 RepID=A0A286TWN9_9BACT|nr:dimethyladenosine transferase [Candidatus Scalindua japonica]